MEGVSGGVVRRGIPGPGGSGLEFGKERSAFNGEPGGAIGEAGDAPAIAGEVALEGEVMGAMVRDALGLEGGETGGVGARGDTKCHEGSIGAQLEHPVKVVRAIGEFVEEERPAAHGGG